MLSCCDRYFPGICDLNAVWSWKETENRKENSYITVYIHRSPTSQILHLCLQFPHLEILKLVKVQEEATKMMKITNSSCLGQISSARRDGRWKDNMKEVPSYVRYRKSILEQTVPFHLPEEEPGWLLFCFNILWTLCCNLVSSLHWTAIVQWSWSIFTSGLLLRKCSYFAPMGRKHTALPDFYPGHSLATSLKEKEKKKGSQHSVVAEEQRKWIWRTESFNFMDNYFLGIPLIKNEQQLLFRHYF